MNYCEEVSDMKYGDIPQLSLRKHHMNSGHKGMTGIACIHMFTCYIIY